ncbi:zinc ribbon-containing protein [Rheinheimera sp. NSM]|uniref:zinc ribbon-containing protein n=1 Tax=Rheinheimera sp. NSM TaxID=3457884 RepID=UPI004036441D
MTDFVKKYQQWLSEFSRNLQQTEQQQLDNMVEFVEQLKAYIKAGRELSAYETQLFIETLKRQWQEQEEQQHEADADTSPSLWPEALWQELSSITDKSQLEWQELAQDFKHQGVYYQGEVVGMGRYRCSHCLQHIDYTHPAELLACSQCGGVQFFREGLPV